MRDPLLNESLRRLAAEAATRFTTLVASGDQIPFDVAGNEGPDDSFFHSYVPLTGRYVRERETEIHSLPSFEAVREAIDASGVAAPYLEQRGELVPADPAERAGRLLTVFLAQMWDGCAEFSLDASRLESAIAVLDAEASSVDEAELLVVPVAGLKMPGMRLALPHGAQLVRADAFDAPAEARRSEGMGREAWEPQFFAVAELRGDAGGAGAALAQLRDLVSVMRLFKPGGVGLGPYAFVPSGEGSWRRIATGAPAPRPGGYELNAEGAAELAELARALEARPDPAGPLAWAVRRFELGCERPDALEGLSDQMLALRAVLEGQGPVGASLPMRAAALVSSGSSERLAIRERIEAAQRLERAAMAGATAPDAEGLATWVEDSVRGILRDAALGELGADLNQAADESLIANGLSGGDIQVAVTANDQFVRASDEVAEQSDQGSQGVGARPAAPGRSRAKPGSPVANAPWEEAAVDSTKPSPGSGHGLTPPGPGEGRADHHESPQEVPSMDEDTRILEPIPAEDEIRITATDWLEEVEEDDRIGVDEEATLDFPSVAGDLERRERIDTPRVRHLFPVPEDADWDVRELDYTHYARRRTG
jgi:hypothetical protein